MNDLMTIQKRPPTKYSVSEAKKAELDLLESNVVNAKHEVEQLNAIVSSLTTKFQKFEGFLNEATSAEQTAKSNNDTMKMAIQSAEELADNSKIAFSEMKEARYRTNKVSEQSKVVIDELIYSAEVINKLANLVVREKGLNPLISDELVSMAAQAKDDANNAVALSLVALKSSISAQTSNVESESIACLELIQAEKLEKVLKENTGNRKSLKVLLSESVDNAEKELAKIKIGHADTKDQLNEAKVQLSNAQIKLSSLQASLAAAKAAAFAAG